MRFAPMFILAAMALLVSTVMAQQATDTNMQILMEKVKADKKLLVASNMNLSDADGKKFWPLYEAYQKDLEQLNQRLRDVIKKYADTHNAGNGVIPNDTAKQLLNEALAVEEGEVKLKRAYADKLSKVFPATTVARAVQIETKIRNVIKAQLSMAIPLVY